MKPERPAQKEVIMIQKSLAAVLSNPKTPLGGTVLSPTVWTHPVRIYPDPNPVGWKLLRRVNVDDHDVLGRYVTEEEAIRAFRDEFGGGDL